MYCVDRHLFVNDDDILARERLQRRVHALRREATEPVLLPDGADEGSAIGYASVARDPETSRYKLWYPCMSDGLLRLAVSDDLLHWTRRSFASSASPDHFPLDNVSVAPVGTGVDPWFAGAGFVGIGFTGEPPNPGDPPGIYAIRSMDGERFEARLPAILPHKGDRSYMNYDGVSDEYILISRPYYGYLPGFKPMHGAEVVRHRMARMWKSKDLINWEDHGIVLRYDDWDPPDTEIYGMQPFRCGKGFLAFVEVYHGDEQRLDTQLAYSEDGLRWQRVGRREPVLSLGGEGSWDSHWVTPTLNPPFLSGERLLVPYIGASTKHGSGKRHNRAIGLAGIGKDRWVSMEAGRLEGTVVTRELPLAKPMKLELNVNCYGGYLTVDVISTLPGKEFEPVTGYGADAGHIEQLDSTSHRVTWGDRAVVKPIKGGACFLRFTMKQGSFFSYRWSDAD